jgi:PilZ domain
MPQISRRGQTASQCALSPPRSRENFGNLLIALQLSTVVPNAQDLTMTNAPNTVHPRFPLATTVMVRESRTGAALLTQLRNISLSGCYLETPREMPQNGRVQVVLQAAGLHAEIWGVVRRRDATGIGVQFTYGATVEDWKRLESLIKYLEAQAPATAAATSGSN